MINMAVIRGAFNTNTDVLEEKLRSVDFSKHTDLKARLAQRLFSSTVSAKVSQFEMLSDEAAELVNAEQGIFVPENKDENK